MMLRRNSDCFWNERRSPQISGVNSEIVYKIRNTKSVIVNALKCERVSRAFIFGSMLVAVKSFILVLLRSEFLQRPLDAERERDYDHGEQQAHRGEQRVL